MKKQNFVSQQPEMLSTPLSEDGGKYAQLVTAVTSQYDATLIFYQVQPKQVGLENGKPQIMTFQKEVSRITIPLKALTELQGTLRELTMKGKGKKSISKKLK